MRQYRAKKRAEKKAREVAPIVQVRVPAQGPDRAVSPAHAGMYRFSRWWSILPPSFPRTCGDMPCCSVQLRHTLA